jgi:hypothetical protein
MALLLINVGMMLRWLVVVVGGRTRCHGVVFDPLPPLRWIGRPHDGRPCDLSELRYGSALRVTTANGIREFSLAGSNQAVTTPAVLRSANLDAVAALGGRSAPAWRPVGVSGWRRRWLRHRPGSGAKSGQTSRRAGDGVLPSTRRTTSRTSDWLLDHRACLAATSTGPRR